MPEKPYPSPSKDDFRDKLAPVPEELYTIPSLADIGIDEVKDCGDLLFPGGESEALKRMERYLQNKKYITTFEKPNTSPNSINPSTTVLSPYLKFGNLSSRLFYHRIKEIYK